MISITRLVTTLTAIFALATVCLAQEHAKTIDLGDGTAFKGKTTEMKDNGRVAYHSRQESNSRRRQTALRTLTYICSSTTRPAKKSVKTTHPARSVR
jgi:hypothetical protein